MASVANTKTMEQARTTALSSLFASAALAGRNGQTGRHGASERRPRILASTAAANARVREQARRRTGGQ